MEELTTNVEGTAPVQPEEIKWYKSVSYEDAKIFIKSNITSAARSFIAIGYYLKLVRDKEMYREDGHETIWDFAQAEYGISKSTASRYMTMNDRFSKDGNSPVICDEYKEFGKSQLQEMLSLTDEQMEQVSPSDRVEDIRNVRKPKEIPYIHIPGQVELIDFPGVDPEDVATAAKDREEMAAREPVKQTYTISAEDLLPEPEQQEAEETIAISQQSKEAHKLTPGTGEDCGCTFCWDCVKHGDCKLECYSSEQRPAEIEPLSAYGTAKRVYPEGSLLTTLGCEGGHDCIFCAMDCQIRQAERYCREAPMGNPFPCVQVSDLDALRDAVGTRCQFVNPDFAEHTAGSNEPNPCCKQCQDPCEHICSKAAKCLEPKSEIYDRSILQSMIKSEEEQLRMMGPTWMEKQPHYYTKHMMALEAYKMLWTAHGEGNVEFEQSGD